MRAWLIWHHSQQVKENEGSVPGLDTEELSHEFRRQNPASSAIRESRSPGDQRRLPAKRNTYPGEKVQLQGYFMVPQELLPMVEDIHLFISSGNNLASHPMILMRSMLHPTILHFVFDIVAE